MNSRFSRAMARADRVIDCQLNDHAGTYLDAAGQRIAGLALMLDRSIELSGAMEIFPAGQIVITTLKEKLNSTRVQRGELFEVGNSRYIVQETLKDDGAFISFLCLEDS